MFISNAWAQEGGGGAAQGGFQLIFLVVMVAVFYFLLIRPQSKRQKEHRKMVEGLASGDEVVTGGGVLGKITEVGEQFVTIEIADGVTIRVQKATIGTVVPKGTMKSA